MKKLCLMFMLLCFPLWGCASGVAGTPLASCGLLLQAAADTPFLLSTWAYMVYAILFLALLVAAHFMILRKERERLALQQEAEEADREKEIRDMKMKFVTSLGHELRIPLSLVISPLELLIKERESDTELVSKLEVARRNAVRLQNQVNQLLDLSKGDMNRLHLNMAESDVVAFVNSVCASFTLLSERENISFTFSPGVPSLKMSFDKDKLGKVMMNLLSNAFKFTDAGGAVDVKMDLVLEQGLPDLLEIKVSDTGIGIRDEDKEKIFERFYQVERENGESSGSGVGLAFVHDFVTMHGGTVNVIDNLPSGSVFIIRLPMKPSKVKEVEKKEDDEIVVVRAQKGAKPQPAGGIITIESVRPEADAATEETEDDNIGTVTTVKAQKATVIQLTEDDEEQIVTRVVPADELPDIVTSAKEEGAKENRSSAADSGTAAKPKSETKKERGAKRPAAKAADDSENEENEGITIQDEKLLEAATRYVDANISRSDLSVEELSNELGISRVYLYKKLVAITGKTPVEFIRGIRLERAALLLRETQRNVSDIAVQVGINNPKYFSRYFKEAYGVLPSVYQEQRGF